MLPNEFIRQTVKFWSAYFEKIKHHAKAGQLLSSPWCNTYYPLILICTETPDLFLAELLGIQEEYRGLNLKRQRQDSAILYVNQPPLPAGASVLQLSKGNKVQNLCIGHQVDIRALCKRFPVVDLFPTRIFQSEEVANPGSAIQFRTGFQSAQIDNCVVINRLGSIFRAKHVLSLTMVSRALSPAKYREFLFDMVAGEAVSAVHTVPPGKEKDYVVAGQFQNMYLSPKLRETTIGEFLNGHSGIVLRAFSGRRHVYEPHLPWIESGGSKTESAINPDLLVEAQDGHCDIYDLKTAALGRTSLTKGPRSRRRFIEYVDEGIAQLANYEEYFSFEKNREYARSRYGVTVEDPRLTLIVGSFENANAEEMVEASRMLRNTTVIDYDTLTQLFLAAPTNSG